MPRILKTTALCHVWALHLFGSWLAGEVEGLDHLLDVTPEPNRNEVVHLNREEIRVLYITPRIVYGFVSYGFLNIKGLIAHLHSLRAQFVQVSHDSFIQGLKCDVRLVPHEVALHQ